MKIRKMIISDYDEIFTLLRQTPGVVVREADSRSATQKYLKRNPGLSFVALVNDEIVGCVMSGHDGRRGYLQHLVVRPECREMSIGEKLFTSSLRALETIGIDKTHIFVLKDNLAANEYWLNRGWRLREDVQMYSYSVSGSADA